ncbi:MAG: hypothetical protein SGBAC_005746 [Bacillariaceae sp.]
MRKTSLVAVGVGILHLITSSAAAENRRHDARKKVLDWLAEDPDFTFSDKLAMRDGRIVVEKTIEAGEVLMVIPGSKILTMYYEEEEYEEEDPNFCFLYEALDYEIHLGEESKFAPYMQQIQSEQSEDVVLPSLWSNTAQRLLILVSITSPNFDIVSLIDDYSGCIYYLKEEEDVAASILQEHQAKYKDGDKTGNIAIEISPKERTDRLILALAIKHQIDRTYFVPLLDQLPHHHLTYNVKHNTYDDESIEVVALKTIYAGEEISRQSRTCLQECNPQETTVSIDILKKYGEVQPYPHFWKFGNDLSFIYNGNLQLKSLVWINPPTREFQLQVMEKELTRQRKAYKNEVLLSKDSIDPKEWEQIDRYCRSLMGALKDAIKQGYEYLETLATLERNDDSDADSEDGSLGPSDQGAEKHNDVDATCSAEDVVGVHYQEEEVITPGSNKERIYEEMFGMEDAMKDAMKDSMHLGYLPGEAQDPWLVKGCGLSEKCSMAHIALSRGCKSYAFVALRNETEWATMRSAYIATVGPRKASIQLSYGSGFRVPIKVGHSPGRGRGVFATTDIPKGTLVWASVFTATFEEGYQFRMFLSVLPDDMVCDLLFWCYTFKDGRDHVIACDLDESSLFNHADHGFEYNVGEIKVAEAQGEQKRKAGDVDSAFALRDIELGEELVTAYDEFHSFGFEEMGL